MRGVQSEDDSDIDSARSQLSPLSNEVMSNKVYNAYW